MGLGVRLHRFYRVSLSFEQGHTVLSRFPNVRQLIAVFSGQPWVESKHPLGEGCVLEQEEDPLETQHGVVAPLTLGVALSLVY